MRTADAFLAALENLASHKLRSALTMLGMMFGVGAVISMLSIGAGAEQQAMDLIDRMGVRNVLVRNQYRPLRRKSRSAMTALQEGVKEGTLTVEEVLRHYVSRVHADTDNYLETARRLGIDHRTVRRHLDDDLISEYRGN